MQLLHLFKKCVYGTYIHVENAGDYYTERIGTVLYIYLECSHGRRDWLNNLDFPAKPYKRMGQVTWFAHRGFVRVWKSIEPYLEELVSDKTLTGITIVGYSHGAALAVLCHEYVWYHRPDLRHKIQGYGFGCPRVFWGFKTPQLARRWKGFTVLRNIDDVVTHMPPAIWGFSHVGKMIRIGEKGKYSKIDAHRPENIIAELKKYGG